jgi:hypothetical protein
MKNNMKLFTLIIATTCLITTSKAASTQQGVTSQPNAATASIKFNSMGIANGVVKVKMYNQPEGIYTIQVMDAAGKVIANKSIQHTKGIQTETADFGKTFTGGTYQLEVTAPNNAKTHETIMLLM